MADQMPKIGTFCWNELATNDPDKAREFYTELLGWTVTEMPMPSGTYTMFKAGEAQAGGMFKITPEMGQVPPHWMGYITVEDADETAKKVEQLGGKVAVPPMDVPGVGRMITVIDPTGATVSMMAFPKK
ncbi:MAG: VOC family protein [candidate division Zixibacteria bacterium]|nr:VOC family protein [candidate division Zixibacteria bacterium]